MNLRPVIELRQFHHVSPDSARILDFTRESIERLNDYIADFVGTVEILKENYQDHMSRKDYKTAEEVRSNIDYMERKIIEVSLEMQNIAKSLPALVDYQEVVN